MSASAAPSATLYVAEFLCANRAPHVEAFHTIASAQAALPRLAQGRTRLHVRLTPWTQRGVEAWPLLGRIPLWVRGESFDLGAPL